jgi:hypothetical protein
MFKNYTHQDLAVIELLPVEEEQFTRKAKRKRIWIHKSLNEKKS